MHGKQQIAFFLRGLSRRLAAATLFLSFLPVLCPSASPAEDTVKREIPMREDTGLDYRKVFQGEFDNPVVNMAPSPVRGIHAGTACDRSDLAEDPFTPTFWIVTNDGYKAVLSTESLRAALKRVGFVPRSGSDALQAARMNFSGDEFILQDTPQGVPFPASVPAEVRAQVQEPRAVKQGDGYEVVLFTYFRDSVMQWFEDAAPPEQVTRYVIRVGKDRFDVFPATLWSSGNGK